MWDRGPLCGGEKLGEGSVENIEHLKKTGVREDAWSQHAEGSQEGEAVLWCEAWRPAAPALPFCKRWYHTPNRIYDPHHVEV